MSVPDHMLDPEAEALPCAKCAGEAAAQLAHDAAFNLKYGETLLTDAKARAEFEERFGPYFVAMAAWLYDHAEAEQLKQDNDPCERHRPNFDED